MKEVDKESLLYNDFCVIEWTIAMSVKNSNIQVK